MLGRAKKQRRACRRGEGSSSSTGPCCDPACRPAGHWAHPSIWVLRRCKCKRASSKASASLLLRPVLTVHACARRRVHGCGGALAGTGAAMHACARCRLRAWPFDPESLWNSGSLPLAPCRTQHQQWRLRCHAFPIYGLTPRKTGKNGLHKPTKRSSRECEEDCTPRS